jgi:hypothetical protein
MAKKETLLNTMDFSSITLPTQVPLQGKVKLEAAQTSEMLESYQNTTWHHNPIDTNLNLQFHGNLKSQIGMCLM